MKPLRESVATLVARHGGVLTTRELAEALAAARGSTADGEVRLHRAGAAAAAALDTESGALGLPLPACTVTAGRLWSWRRGRSTRR